PAHFGNAARIRFVVRRESALRQQTGGRGGGQRIANLEASRQRWLDRVSSFEISGSRSSAVAAVGSSDALNLPGLVHLDEPRTKLRAPPPNHAARFSPLARTDHPRAWLNDSCFLAGDLFNRMAQKILVIEINGSDDSHFWIHDVRGIQPSTQSDLVHSEIQ